MPVSDVKTFLVVGHLALTRKRPSEKEAPVDPKGEQKAPDYFNPEILAWVMKTVGDIDEDFKETDRFGKTTSPIVRYFGLNFKQN